MFGPANETKSDQLINMSSAVLFTGQMKQFFINYL